MPVKYQVAPEVISGNISEEAVLMSIESGAYYALDSVASRIWTLLSQEPASVDELTEMLLREYDVDEPTCRKDVEEFIRDMLKRKLLVEVK
ncbi:MAG: PqqD family protein [Bacteroidales bacterium]